MEYGRWEESLDEFGFVASGLNPCCNGIWSVGHGKKFGKY